MYNDRIGYIIEDPRFSSDYFRRVLYLSCRHWRTLETLSRISQNSGSYSDYDSLIKELQNKRVRRTLINKDEEDIVLEALDFEEYKFTKIITDNRTFENLISNGYYLNTAKYILDLDLEEAIDTTEAPIMSALMIEIWTRQTKGHLPNLLGEIFDFKTRQFDWNTFEKFHGVWEAIRRYVLRKKICKISDLYKGLGLMSKEFFDREIFVERFINVVFDHDDIFSLSLNDELCKNSYILGGRNEGLDILLVHKEVKDGEVTDNNIFIAINAKYSSLDNQYLEKDRIIHTHNHTHKKLESSALNVKSDSIYTIVVGWYHIRPKIRKEFQTLLLKNTIVLGKEELKVLYSSLNQRPYLGFDHRAIKD